MLRIFTTGDNHIGLKYLSHEKASLLAESRIDSFSDMVARANVETCDLFVITGDLFENTYGISKKEIKAILDALSLFKGTVAILPGNHDYYDRETKLWQYFESLLSAYHNILLLSEYRPYSLEVNEKDVVLYPALCTSLHSAPGENNLTWIKNEDIPSDSVFRIGVAHGAIDGETIDSEGRYFLMTRRELDDIPMDAWLIGHTHVPFPRNLTEEYAAMSEKIFNAGTHVQTDVACNTEGQCFIIEVSDDKTLRAKKFISSPLRFFRKNINLTAGNAESILLKELSEFPDSSVVDIILSGAVTSDEYESRTELLASALSRFIEGTYNDYGLSKLISEDIIRSEFPETSLSAKLLFALLDNPKEAQLAYELLKEVKQ